MRGPYGNGPDRSIYHYIGVPLISVRCSLLRGEGFSPCTCLCVRTQSHQESWSPNKVPMSNKDCVFDRAWGFVSSNTLPVHLPHALPIDMSDPNQYLQLVEAVIQSGVPNYRGVRVPLSSGFNLQYLKEMLTDYHDKILIDYLTFGFLLGLTSGVSVKSNAKDNHASALNYPEAVEEYIKTEKSHRTLLGPFQVIPHSKFTWAPLMTRPKGRGHRVNIDLSIGDHSVNKATARQAFDSQPFTLKLPTLEALIPQLERLGQDARLFKVDISRAFRNVRMDPGDAIRLGIKWNNEYFIDQNLPFGAVHGTAIFERITDLIHYIMAGRGVTVWNYIDDMYACCYKDVSERAFQGLLDTIRLLGLPINQSKVFPPTKKLSIMGILVDINEGTFSIENEKLTEISNVCTRAFVCDVITKHDLQSLLGKLLYISRCVRGSRIFMNRLLNTLREHHDKQRICPDVGFYLDLSWFLRFLKTFSGTVRFRRESVANEAQVDATLTGIGGAWGNRVYAERIPNHLINKYSITQYEMYNVVIALKIWAHAWKHKIILAHCDNESTVRVCNRGATRDSFFNRCLHEIWLVATENKITLKLKHIPGKDNSVADALSRGKFVPTDDIIWEQVSLEDLCFIL